MYDQQIKSVKNLTKRDAIKLARKEANYANVYNMKKGEKGFIYIDGPTVSDLIVIVNGKFRECEDKEWNWYYHNVLYPSDGTWKLSRERQRRREYKQRLKDKIRR